MTQINVNITLSGNTLFNGLVRVTLTRPLSTDTSLALPVPQDYPVVNGVASFMLLPSQADNIPYRFEVIQTVDVPTDNTTTPPTPAFSYEVVLDTFTSVVPSSFIPITFNSLVESSGIFLDNTDASFVSLARRLYYSNGFWDTLQTTVFKVRGVYSNSLFYIRGDVVLFNGSSFLNVSSVQQSGIVPSLIEPYTTWFPMGIKGDNGTGTAGNDAAYDATAWNGATDAPSRNAVRDIIETLATKTSLTSGYVPKLSGILDNPTLVAEPPVADSTLKIPSTSWVQALVNSIKNALNPIGSLQAYCGTSPPTGWLLCDGRTVSTTTYAALFLLLGTTFNTGGEAGGTFRLPDLRGRVIAGMDAMTGLMGSANRLTASAADNMGGTLGAETHTLITAEMPSHSHAPNGSSGTSPTFVSVVTAAGSFLNAANGTGTTFGTAGTTANTGGGGAHNNVQPTITFTYIIYTGL